MARCTGLFGLSFGHKLRPRYSTTESTPDWVGEFFARVTKLNGSALADLLEKGKEVQSTYEGDVCVRCGHMVHRRMWE